MDLLRAHLNNVMVSKLQPLQVLLAEYFRCRNLSYCFDIWQTVDEWDNQILLDQYEKCVL